MVYDSNGFNFNGHSITESYDTTLAGQVATRTSGFSKGTVDIATLISPAVAGATGATTASGAYTGFGGLDFDVAFSSTTIPGAKVSYNNSNSSSIYSSDSWKINNFTSNSGIFSIVFPSTVAGSATAISYKIAASAIIGHAVIVGGGGGGGSSLYNHVGSGGGGAGAVATVEFNITEDITFNITIGAGGAGGTSGSYGGSGGYSELIGTGGSNPPTVKTYGGTGGGGTNNTVESNVYYFDPARVYPNSSGSTGGAPANANNIDHGSRAYTLSSVGATHSNTTTTTVYRHKGGDDEGYGLSGGGGGGAYQDGFNQTGPYNRIGGRGGDGIFVWDRQVGGGGGGLHSYDPVSTYPDGVGGAGGGGAALRSSGAAGTAGTGGGGGASVTSGGAGGSGLIMLIFRTNTGIFD